MSVEDRFLGALSVASHVPLAFLYLHQRNVRKIDTALSEVVSEGQGTDLMHHVVSVNCNQIRFQLIFIMKQRIKTLIACLGRRARCTWLTENG